MPKASFEKLNSITNRMEHIEQSSNNSNISNISTNIRDQPTTYTTPSNPITSFPFENLSSKVTIPLGRRGRQPLGGPFFPKRNKSTVYPPCQASVP